MDQRQEFVQSSASVRSDLERIRLETQREIDRLNRELLERLEAADRCVDSATDQLALEQEADRLRHALREREASLDAITTECRRLEDQLEDQHLAYDGLKQELDRKLAALTHTRERVDRLEAELERLRAGDRSGWLAPISAMSGDGGSAASPMGGAWPKRRRLAAVGLGILLVAVVVAILWRQPADSDAERPRVASSPPLSAAAGSSSAGSPLAPGAASAEPLDAAPAVMVVSTRRDLLRDGRAGPLMIELRGGLFTMGRDTPDAPESGPARRVAVRSFLIGAYEVSFDEYDPFARATGRRLPDDFGWGRGARPVVDVSWRDATAFAQWLGRETGERYRLPSEAEWELAARGGSDASYWWGGYPERGRAVCFDCGTAWDNRSTAPIASFSPNPYGLYDTAGNVAEWVADCYRPSYRGAPSDGRAWDAEPCKARVIRGGAFSRPANSMRGFARGHLAPATRLNMVGFRLARDP